MPDSKKTAVAQSELAARKQRRGRLTRQKLLRAARVIFARDGFEHARLEDIAANAGKSRGAFYDNFKNKEDVFCAIFEENIDLDLAALGPLLFGLPTLEQRIVALSEYLSELSKDRERTLLNLEFKLYAIRHPRKRKRLADLYALMCVRCEIPNLGRSLQRLDGAEATTELMDSLAIGAIMDGLALNHLFNPEALDNEEVAYYLKLCLQGTFESTLRLEVEPAFIGKRPESQ